MPNQTTITFIGKFIEKKMKVKSFYTEALRVFALMQNGKYFKAKFQILEEGDQEHYNIEEYYYDNVLPYIFTRANKLRFLVKSEQELDAWFSSMFLVQEVDVDFSKISVDISFTQLARHNILSQLTMGNKFLVTKRLSDLKIADKLIFIEKVLTFSSKNFGIDLGELSKIFNKGLKN